MTSRWRVAWAPVLVAAACAPRLLPAAGGDLVLIAGGGLTMDSHHPTAQAVAIRGERILAVGSRGEVLAVARRPRVLDFGAQARLLPGFNDAHVHISLQLVRTSAREVPAAAAAAERIAAVRAHLAAPGQPRWGLFRIAAAVSAADRDWLESAAGDRPAALLGANGVVLNAAAARASEVGKLAEDGVVESRLYPSALSALARDALGPERIVLALRDFLDRARRLGITSAQIVVDDFEDLAEPLRRQGALTCRLRFIPAGLGAGGSIDLIERPPGPEPARLRTAGRKFFLNSDGPSLPPDRLRELLRAAAAARTQLVMHVLGAPALDQLLDAVEAVAPAIGRGLRIEHADVVTPEAAGRLAALRLPVCANSTLLLWWKDPAAFPLRRLIDAGIPLCLASDWVGDADPGRRLAPLFGVKLAVERPEPGRAQAIGVADALRAMTAVPAFTEGLEEQKGILRPGALADVVVLGADPLTTAAERLEGIPVLATVVGGEIVYRADATGPAPDRPAAAAQ